MFAFWIGFRLELRVYTQIDSRNGFLKGIVYLNELVGIVCFGHSLNTNEFKFIRQLFMIWYYDDIVIEMKLNKTKKLFEAEGLCIDDNETWRTKMPTSLRKNSLSASYVLLTWWTVRAGLLQVYIRTSNNVLIEINPSTRIPRTFSRFAGKHENKVGTFLPTSSYLYYTLNLEMVWRETKEK